MEARWYQQEASNALMSCLGKDVHPIVSAPTASGKSFMICDFIDRYLSKYPVSNVLVLSHVKEILEQDFDALEEFFDTSDIGLYSAGMHSRTIEKITVAGIQSVYNKPKLFKGFHLIIIDECHLVTIRANGQYRKFLAEMDANYVGFTATHFRLGHGYIHRGEGALFNHMAYDMSRPEIFNRLVEEGYLAKLITKATIMKMNVDDIKLRAKDFALDQLSQKFDRESITETAVKEIIEYGHNYKKWLVFGIDIDHAEHITDMFKKHGVDAAVVHSKMDADRDEVVHGFRTGKYRAVVNVDILTTGLNVRDIDLIAVLRPTESPVIHVQTIGRGLRPFPGKAHCLVLDFAGNTARLGPINDVVIKQKRKGTGTGQQIVKECPKCMALHPPATKICDVCGYEFKFKVGIAKTAGTEEVVRTHVAQWYKVDDVTYKIHAKLGKKSSMKVTYRIGLQTFHEWVCFAHNKYPKYKADNWVRKRAPEGMPWPKSLTELITFAPWLKKPSEVLINLSDKLPQIKDSKFPQKCV